MILATDFIVSSAVRPCQINVMFHGFTFSEQGGDTPLYRVKLSSSTGQNKVNGQLGIFSIVNGQATIFL